MGWAVAPPAITNAIRKVHDFLTVGAPAPLQEAGAAALGLPPSYYRESGRGISDAARPPDSALERAGFRCFRPRGAYYVMTDISGFGFANDVEFTRYLVKEIGVAAFRDRVSIMIRKTERSRYDSRSAKSRKPWMKRDAG